MTRLFLKRCKFVCELREMWEREGERKVSEKRDGLATVLDEPLAAEEGEDRNGDDDHTR